MNTSCTRDVFRFIIWGLGVEVLGLSVQGIGPRNIRQPFLEGLGFDVESLGFRNSNLEFRGPVQSSAELFREDTLAPVYDALQL